MKRLLGNIVEPFRSLKLTRKQLIFTSAEGLLILAVSTFLVGKSLSINPQRYQQSQDNALRLKELETVFNKEVLRSRYELFTSYDILGQSLSGQRMILEELRQSIPASINPSQQQAIQDILDQKERSLEEKERLSEWFKTRNAQLKNSLRYLPLLTSQIETKFVAQRQTNSLEPQQLATLSSTLNQLIRNLLLYNVAVDEQLLEDVERLANQLSQLDIEYGLRPDDFPTQIINYHTNIILQTKPEIEELTTRLTQGSTVETEDLEQIFQTSYQQAVTSANRYLVLSILWFLGLLVLITYWLLERSPQFTPSIWISYQTKLDKIATTLNQPPGDGAVSVTQLHSLQQQLEQLVADIQEEVQQSLTQSDGLQQQISVLSPQIEAGIIEQEQAAILAEEEKLNQQILALSKALEKSQHTRNLAASSSDAPDVPTAHLSLLTPHQKKLFTPEILDHLRTVLASTLNERNCKLLEFQGYSEQVRLWFCHPASIQLSDLVSHLKHVSDHSVKETFSSDENFADASESIWSDTYFITGSNHGSSQVLEANAG